MSIILIDNEEMEQEKAITNFLKVLSPQMQEKVKTIVWWENLKAKSESVKKK